MKAVYVTTDGEWYPMINICEDDEGKEYAIRLDLDDGVSDFVVAAYRNFDIAHEMLMNAVDRKQQRRRNREDV